LNQKRKLLKPSQGVHLIFERSRFPVPAALLLMKGQRILFVIPREDLGAGVVIVGTTDAPSPENPGLVQVTNAERTYLLECLEEYFPELKLTVEDIISEYVGVRPLFSGESKEGELSTVSREHHIEEGPEGMTVVVGGKYTTHRRMAEEIVQFHLKRHEFVEHPDFKNTQREPIDWIQENIKKTTEIQKLDQEFRSRLESLLGSELKLKPLEGFENLLGHLIFAIRFEAVLHVEDFVLRRVPLYLARRDHGREWFKVLCQALLLEKTAKIDGWEEELKRLNLVLNSLSSPAVTVIESKQATFDS
jgi:glycerol-3-phosphate dehydrogenase